MTTHFVKSLGKINFLELKSSVDTVVLKSTKEYLLLDEFRLSLEFRLLIY